MCKGDVLSDKKDVFIIGAGFSKAISNHMPTLAELSQDIRQDLDKLFLDHENPPEEMASDIERLLSFLGEDHPWLTKAQQHRNRSAFLELSSIIATKLKDKQDAAIQGGLPAWLSKLVNTWHKKRVNVITFNYDILVEKEAAKIQAGNVSTGPAGTTGYITQDDLYPVTITSALLRQAGVWGNDPHETFRLFKMHGSINWYYSGSDEFYGEPIYTTELRDVNSDKEIRAAVRDKVPLIIPPTLNKTIFFKNETIRIIWQTAGDALKRAHRVFCLGYSFPITDMMIRFFTLTNKAKENVTFYWVNINKHQVDLREILPKSYSINEDYVKDDAITAFAEDYTYGKIA